MYRYRAVAIDYDGTLTVGPRPSVEALAAVREYRDAGGTAILCTGRILHELRSDFPEVERHFDAIIGENGAVMWTATIGERALASPVDQELELRLRATGVSLRRGIALLATQAKATEAAAREIANLGLDAQLIHNRNELMVLPAGVSKGTGLLEVLGELGISRHDTAAIGDAENDHALLATCELGVAVSNAVDSLLLRADVVLSGCAGEGVIEFLRGPIVRGEIVVHPARWMIEVGSTSEGEAVTIPGSDADVLIAGSTGSGKSHLAGLLVERAVEMGYTVCVVDPEGDHTQLDILRGVLLVGTPASPPEPAEVTRVMRNRFTSVVIDLSLLDEEEQRAYWLALSAELHALRRETGGPNWVVLEEADRLLAGGVLKGGDPRNSSSGFCLVTYRPDALSPTVLTEIDSVLALRGAEHFARIPVLDAEGTLPAARPDKVFTLESGTALIADRQGVRAFRPGARRTPHVRHWHKYVSGQVAPDQRFFFRSDDGGLTGRSAGNVIEFQRETRRAPSGVLGHHLRNGDFSRWFQDVIQDDKLAAETRALERWVQCESRPDPEAGRKALLRLMERRYGTNGGAAHAPTQPPPDRSWAQSVAAGSASFE